MTYQQIIDRAAEMESAGLRFCFTCAMWEDDTDCFPDDHSRHCGHELKPLGLEIAREYRLICTEQFDLLVVMQKGRSET